TAGPCLGARRLPGPPPRLPWQKSPEFGAELSPRPGGPGRLERNIRAPARVRRGGIPRLAEAARHADRAGRAGRGPPGAPGKALPRPGGVAHGRRGPCPRAGGVVPERPRPRDGAAAAALRPPPLALVEGAPLVPRPRQRDRKAVPVRSALLLARKPGLESGPRGDARDRGSATPLWTLLPGPGPQARSTARRLVAGTRWP